MKQLLIGKKVKDIRNLTDDEMEEQGWEPGYHDATAIVFDDGTQIFASADEEGNGPGAMFGRTADGQNIYVFADA